MRGGMGSEGGRIEGRTGVGRRRRKGRSEREQRGSIVIMITGEIGDGN